jgi:hypothetical protein
VNHLGFLAWKTGCLSIQETKVTMLRRRFAPLSQTGRRD